MAGKQWLQEREVAAHTGICSICSQEAERQQGEGDMFGSLFVFPSRAPSPWDGDGSEGRASHLNPV